jgi:hypothetical protein
VVARPVSSFLSGARRSAENGVPMPEALLAALNQLVVELRITPFG